MLMVNQRILTAMHVFFLSRYCRSFTTGRIFSSRKVLERSRQLLSSVKNTANPEAAEKEKKVPTKFVSFPFEYREEVELEVETLTNRGWGLARYELPPDVENVSDEEVESNKWVVMIPNVIPGERVKVAVFRNMKNYSEADLLEVLEPSPDRVTPKCPIAETCGGCQLQHLTVEAQRRWKTSFVQEGLGQYDIDFEVSPTIGTEETYGYRSKLTPHFNAPGGRRRRRAGDEPVVPMHIQAIGFQCMTSRAIVDVESCPIATPAINVKYQEMRKELLAEPTDRRKGATLLLRQGNADDDYVETKHQNYLTTTVKGLDFEYLAGNFFQNNYFVVPLMVENVIAEAVRGGGMTHLADCYCGSGLFAVSAADNFEKVVGIEINDKAVAEATRNAERNNKTNCEFLSASSENIFQEIGYFPRDTSVVVLDPPRKGCSTEFLEQLYQFGPKRIVYMSCDPITQARDAAGITKAGYTIKSVQPYDLFPQTRHIECLMILDRRS